MSKEFFILPIVGDCVVFLFIYDPADYLYLSGFFSDLRFRFSSLLKLKLFSRLLNMLSCSLLSSEHPFRLMLDYSLIIGLLFFANETTAN